MDGETVKLTAPLVARNQQGETMTADGLYSMAMEQYHLSKHADSPTIANWHQGQMEAFVKVLRMVAPGDGRLDELRRLAEELDGI